MTQCLFDLDGKIPAKSGNLPHRIDVFNATQQSPIGTKMRGIRIHNCATVSTALVGVVAMDIRTGQRYSWCPCGLLLQEPELAYDELCPQ